MAYWLLKTEPGVYGIADLARERTTRWDGVANALALKHLRSVAVDDEAMIYHTGGEKRCVGIARVTKASPVDGTIALAFGRHLACPVTLERIKADSAFAGWDLLRVSRLSVVPTPPEFWKRLLALSSLPPSK